MGAWRLFKLSVSGLMLMINVVLFLVYALVGSLPSALSAAAFACYAGMMFYEGATRER